MNINDNVFFVASIIFIIIIIYFVYRDLKRSEYCEFKDEDSHQIITSSFEMGLKGAINGALTGGFVGACTGFPLFYLSNGIFMGSKKLIT